VVPDAKDGESRDTRAAIRGANLSAGLFILTLMMFMIFDIVGRLCSRLYGASADGEGKTGCAAAFLVPDFFRKFLPRAR
jgi:hypothetical protein